MPELTAIEQLRDALDNEGPSPRWHRETYRRHRREWPTLWIALDRLLGETRPVRLVHWLVDPCTTCNGTGKKMGDRAGGMYDCSVCGGSGVVPSKQAKIAIAKQLIVLLHEEPADDIDRIWVEDLDEDTIEGWLKWSETVLQALLKGTE